MDLYSKYNVPVPRYTSYPTVPHWKANCDANEWKEQVKKAFRLTNNKEGISIYIHLPFCESLCTYCACNTRITVNHQVEEPYINSVIKEWDLYLKLFESTPKIKEIHLGGGTPTFFSAINLERLIRSILKNAVLAKHADLSFEAHPANTTKEHLETLYNLGFKRVSFGIQDFDPVVQYAINRFQSVKEVENIMKIAREVGYRSINFDLVYGLPFQTEFGLRSTINEVIKMKPDRIAFYSYAHVPWKKPGQRKFTEANLPVDIIKRELYDLGRKIFLKEGYEEIAMDHFSLKSDDLFVAMKEKRLHRNFMGYTPHATSLLIGLGVSSISDSWTAFSQNVKVVEEYQQRLATGEFPLASGHLLSPSDLAIRKVILDVICNYEAKWTETQKRTLVFKSSIQRLKKLSADGLVKLEPFGLQVTEKGKPFIRNICSCFDQYYWNKGSEQIKFSSSI
jgi:oxygen-independent coproporphyrinogen-3 oxidase